MKNPNPYLLSVIIILLILIVWFLFKNQLVTTPIEGDKPIVEFKDYVSILLSAISVILTAVTVFLALAAIWGYQTFKTTVDSVKSTQASIDSRFKLYEKDIAEKEKVADDFSENSNKE